MQAETAATAPPKPTRDLEQSLADLEVCGACVIEGALDPATLAEVQTALYRAAENDKKHGWAQRYEYGDADNINQRIWNLPSRDPIFCDLAEHPLALEVVRRNLGWPALLSSMSANITGTGGASMVLHTDQGVVPQPWNRSLVYNIGWCVDAFTAENGATLVDFGTHVQNRQPSRDEPTNLQPLEAPAGSMFVLDGRVWHTNGVNVGNGRRAGIFAVYTLPIFMPQENWYLSLNPAVRQFGSETLLTLLGFRPQVMGRVNGLDRI